MTLCVSVASLMVKDWLVSIVCDMFMVWPCTSIRLIEVALELTV